MNKKDFALFLLILTILSIGYFYLSSVYVDIFNLGLSPVRGYIKTGNVVYFIFSSMIFFAGLVILLERRDPSKTLAWLLILVFVPLLGFLFYLIFGRHPRKQRITRKKKILNDHLYPLADSFYQNMSESLEAQEKSHLIKLIYNNADFPPTVNNEIQVLTDGKEIFPAFLAAIEGAKQYIYLETYILRDDHIGTTIGDLLCLKAQAGVRVRLIYDDLGSRHLSKEYLEKLHASGVETAAFFPVRLPFLHRKINYRNHRKILVVDETIGFVGGANIGDEYLGQNPTIGYWRDTHVRIEGTAVYFLQRIFLQDWHFITGKTLAHTPPSLPPATQNNRIVQITASGPDSQWEAIMQVYYYTIATAEKSIYITSPYFIPNESILTALKTAALSGVDVKILLPAKPDHKVVFWAAMSYLEELLEAGVEIYFYHKGFIHAKVLTVDGIVSSIGSANMDQRSFSLNFEVNAFIYDQETALCLQKEFLADLKHARRLHLEEFQARPLRHHFLESIARLFSPLL